MRVTNQEQAFHPIYHYAFITDSREGLIVTNVDTLADGEPRNNFLERALTWNVTWRSARPTPRCSPTWPTARAA
jgi:hypothetical protein